MSKECTRMLHYFEAGGMRDAICACGSYRIPDAWDDYFLHSDNRIKYKIHNAVDLEFIARKAK